MRGGVTEILIPIQWAPHLKADPAMTDYSYSYSTGSPAPDAATETLWSFNSADVMPGPGDAAILHSRRSGAGMLVQPDVVRALELCAPFRSLDAHTQHITVAPCAEEPRPTYEANPLSHSRTGFDGVDKVAGASRHH